jgi:hypothetical protein
VCYRKEAAACLGRVGIRENTATGMRSSGEPIPLLGGDLSRGKEGELERRTWGIEWRDWGKPFPLWITRGEWRSGAVLLPEKEGETIGEEDADMWVPPVIGGREGESYPFGILG